METNYFHFTGYKNMADMVYYFGTYHNKEKKAENNTEKEP